MFGKPKMPSVKDLMDDLESGDRTKRSLDMILHPELSVQDITNRLNGAFGQIRPGNIWWSADSTTRFTSTVTTTSAATGASYFLSNGMTATSSFIRD